MTIIEKSSTTAMFSQIILKGLQNNESVNILMTVGGSGIFHNVN